MLAHLVHERHIRKGCKDAAVMNARSPPVNYETFTITVRPLMWPMA